ncbi:MAG: glutathione S-transferase family protein [Alphaproteobacteria bacterium]|nr:glutathione S-transferase family protein [Alphaproteobacteria bacterium]
MRIFGDARSGNCLKTLWVAQRVGRPHAWIDVDIMKGETRTEAFLRMNPAGQVPCVVFEDGRVLAQSNAIMLHLAEGTDLIPADPFDRAKMLEWLFWEQYSHEPCIAVRRFRKAYLGQSEAEIDPDLMTRGRRALGVMEGCLLARDYFVGEALSLADIALIAYTRMAHEGGFDLSEFPQVTHWIGRVEDDLNLPAYREAA